MKATCFSTLGCAELDWPAVVELARSHHIDKIELRALADRLDLPAYLSENYTTPAAFAARARADGFCVPVIDTSLALTSVDSGARDAFLAVVPWAEALGTRWLRVFDGGKFDPAAPDSNFDAARDTLAWWRDLRARHGWRVELAVETHDSLCSSELIRRFQTSLPTPVPIIWDTWHTWFKNHESPQATWAAISPWLVHVHFKDGLREPVLNYPYRYVVPGTGHYPLAALCTLLDRTGFVGARCLEWERKWHPYLPSLSTALAG